MEDLKIEFKEMTFIVRVKIGKGIFVGYLINTCDSDIVDSFNNNLFFDTYQNEVFEEDSSNLALKITKSFESYINEECTTEEVESEDADGDEINAIILESVKKALENNDSKKSIDIIIKELIKENGIIPHKTIIEFKDKKTGVKKDVGLQHKDFERVLRTIDAKVNIALVGPAGSGKTTIVYNAATTLGLSFASQSVSAQSTVFDFFGYKSATGEYVPTLFREKYEKGGVFLLDEFDAGNPNVLAALNQATANSYCPFPDKMIEKHKDFIIVMAGNTFGGGGTIDYVGRNKIDAATLDRFAFIYIDYDEVLERALSTNEDWCTRVQAYRKIAMIKKVRTIISPRATFNGQALLESGLSIGDVEEMTIFKGLNMDERNLLKIA